jgi:hypothetical protein
MKLKSIERLYRKGKIIIKFVLLEEEDYEIFFSEQK